MKKNDNTKSFTSQNIIETKETIGNCLLTEVSDIKTTRDANYV